MKDIIVAKATFNEEIVNQLVALSKKWVEEDICFGMLVNTKDDLKQPCYIARYGDIIVGYIFGHYYEKKEKTSYIPIGAKCFNIDELYVLPTYRSKGIGKSLFIALQEEIKGNSEYITLSTSTKDYRKILQFYTKNVDMIFHDAYLIKKL